MEQTLRSERRAYVDTRNACAFRTQAAPPPHGWLACYFVSHVPTQSLLNVYGADDVSDTDDETVLPENPMSPEQIALMRAPMPLTGSKNGHHAWLTCQRASLSCSLRESPLTRECRARTRCHTVDRKIALMRELDLDDAPPQGSSAVVVPAAPVAR